MWIALVGPAFCTVQIDVVADGHDECLAYIKRRRAVFYGFLCRGMPVAFIAFSTVFTEMLIFRVLCHKNIVQNPVVSAVNQYHAADCCGMRHMIKGKTGCIRLSLDFTGKKIIYEGSALG